MNSNPPRCMAKLLYLGLPKTGSTSLSKLLANFFTVRHEFDHITACERIWNRCTSGTFYESFNDYFHERERLFDCDIATFTHQAALEISRIYKSSILLAIIRKPEDWVTSFIAMITREAIDHDKQSTFYRNFCQAYCSSISKHISYRGFQYQIQVPKYRQLIISDFLLYYNKYLVSLRKIANTHPDRLHAYEFTNFFDGSYTKLLVDLSANSLPEQIIRMQSEKIPFLNKSISDPRLDKAIVNDIAANDYYELSISLYKSILTDLQIYF